MTIPRRALLLSGAAAVALWPGQDRRDPSGHCWLCGSALLDLPPVEIVCPNEACPVGDRPFLTAAELAVSIVKRERDNPRRASLRLPLSPEERRSLGLQSMREQLNRLGGVDL